jgi:hypothetical protein
VVGWSDPRWDFKRTAEATLTGALKGFYRVATRMGLPGYAQPAPGPLAKHGRAIFEPDYEFQESEIAKAYESSDRRSFGNYCSPLCSPRKSYGERIKRWKGHYSSGTPPAS